MFKRKKKETRGDRPFDRLTVESPSEGTTLEAAIWFNRENPRSPFRIQLSKLMSRRGKTSWSRSFGPEDVIGLFKLVCALANYFSYFDRVPRELRDELRRLAEAFEVAEDAMALAEPDNGNLHHLNGVKNG